MRHYEPNSLLLCCDDMRNRSIRPNLSFLRPEGEPVKLWLAKLVSDSMNQRSSGPLAKFRRFLKEVNLYVLLS